MLNKNMAKMFISNKKNCKLEHHQYVNDDTKIIIYVHFNCR
jgi:hypothetical protein